MNRGRSRHLTRFSSHRGKEHPHRKGTIPVASRTKAGSLSDFCDRLSISIKLEAVPGNPDGIGYPDGTIQYSVTFDRDGADSVMAFHFFQEPGDPPVTPEIGVGSLRTACGHAREMDRMSTTERLDFMRSITDEGVTPDELVTGIADIMTIRANVVKWLMGEYGAFLQLPVGGFDE